MVTYDWLQVKDTRYVVGKNAQRIEREPGTLVFVVTLDDGTTKTH